MFLSPSDFNGSYECDYKDIIFKATTGGYPEILARPSVKRREAWFDSYLTTIIQKDIRKISDIEGLKELPHLLSLLATRVGGLVNFTDISRLSKIPASTLKRYINLLESIFLIISVPSWYTNFEKRLIKTPKLYFGDTGLLSYLLGSNAEKYLFERNLFGHLLENFVVMELFKQRSWNDIKPNIYHYQTHSGKEVDILLESRAGEIVGIEVKSYNQVSLKDFSGLKDLKETVGEKFKLGLILYTGEKTVYFDNNLLALPISALWQN